MMNDGQRDELLIRLDERTDTILKRLEKGDECMKDHDRRIGRLESFQATLIAFVAAISLGVSVFGNWVLSHFKGA